MAAGSASIDCYGELPMGADAGTASNDHQASAPRRVLVVDDNVDAAEMTQMVLELKGHVVTTAMDARSALDVIESFCPEVVLLDIGLPDLDGYELAIRLRQHPNARHARFVAVTGWDQPSDLARSRAQGFVAHLAKPFAMDALLDVVAAQHDAPG